MSKKSLLITLVIILAGVSLFFILRQRGEAPTQEQPTPVVTEEPTTPSSEPIDTSDWKTYRNEEYGFEFKYPSWFSIASSDGSFFNDDVHVLRALAFQQNGKSVVWLLHVSGDSLQQFRSRLLNIDDLAQNNGEPHIVQGDQILNVNGIKITGIQYCHFSVVGVDCNILRSVYFIPKSDGTYIMMRSDPWWGDNVDAVLKKILESFVFK